MACCLYCGWVIPGPRAESGGGKFNAKSPKQGSKRFNFAHLGILFIYGVSVGVDNDYRFFKIRFPRYKKLLERLHHLLPDVIVVGGEELTQDITLRLPPHYKSLLYICWRFFCIWLRTLLQSSMWRKVSSNIGKWSEISPHIEPSNGIIS